MKKINMLIIAGLSLLLLTAINGCTNHHQTKSDRGLTNVTGHGHDVDNFAELCADDTALRDPDLIEICQQQARRFYKDTRDGGGNIFEPGCHRVYDNAACPAQGALFRASGDLCQNATRLAEWTNAQCHPTRPIDSSRFDCNAECRRIGADAGACVTVKNFCAAGIDSAKCECVFL